jgi:hypothetical protein
MVPLHGHHPAAASGAYDFHAPCITMCQSGRLWACRQPGTATESRAMLLSGWRDRHTGPYHSVAGPKRCCRAQRDEQQVTEAVEQRQRKQGNPYETLSPWSLHHHEIPSPIIDCVAVKTERRAVLHASQGIITVPRCGRYRLVSVRLIVTR